MADLLSECKKLFKSKDLYKVFGISKDATQESCELIVIWNVLNSTLLNIFPCFKVQLPVIYYPVTSFYIVFFQ